MRSFRCLASGLALALTVATSPVYAVECAGTGATELVDNIDYCTDTRLEAQAGNRYGPANLFDNDRGTAWCEGVAGNGVGQTITLYIDNGVPFEELLIWNGYQKDRTAFTRNGRMKVIAVTTDFEAEKVFALPDTMAEIVVPLDPMAKRNRVTIEIREVYAGSRYQDTCVSGLFANLETGRDFEPEAGPIDAIVPEVLPPLVDDLAPPPVAMDGTPPPAMREIAPLPELPGL